MRVKLDIQKERHSQMEFLTHHHAPLGIFTQVFPFDPSMLIYYYLFNLTESFFGSIKPLRSLKQGDPFFPYLFY